MGFGYTDLLLMPVNRRKWFVNRFIKERNAQSDVGRDERQDDGHKKFLQSMEKIKQTQGQQQKS